MKRKIITSLVFVVFFGGIFALLMNNKAKSSINAKTDIQKEIPVTATQVKNQNFAENLSMVGVITPNSEVQIASEAEGRVLEMFVKAGDFKQAGAVIAQIDDELKKSAVMVAEVNFDRSKKDYERYKSLNDAKSGSELQKDMAFQQMKSAEAQLITARRQLKDTKILAPISGYITERKIDAGSMIAKNMPVATIVDIASLKVKLNVAEADAFKLKVGDNVEISTEVYPEAKFSGKVQSISAKGDESHTYPVEIVLPNNSKNPLKAGMFARVAFTTISRPNSLMIPREALLGSVKNAQVFVIENGNTAKLKNIVAGDESGGNLLVLQGLQAGETVVVNGQNNLRDGSTVVVR